MKKCKGPNAIRTKNKHKEVRWQEKKGVRGRNLSSDFEGFWLRYYNKRAEILFRLYTYQQRQQHIMQKDSTSREEGALVCKWKNNAWWMRTIHQNFKTVLEYWNSRTNKRVRFNRKMNQTLQISNRQIKKMWKKF